MIACLAAGCSAPPEQPLINRFFAASRLRDKTALETFSTVIFEPKEDGIVTTFEITTVTIEPDGDGRTKNVTLTAPVKLPDGRVEQRRLVITMQRAGESWKITGVATLPLPQRS